MERFEAQERAYREDGEGFVRRFEAAGRWDGDAAEDRAWVARLRADGWEPGSGGGTGSGVGLRAGVLGGGRRWLSGWWFPVAVAGFAATAVAGPYVLGATDVEPTPDRFLPALVPAGLGLMLVWHGVMGRLPARGWWGLGVLLLGVLGAVVHWYAAVDLERLVSIALLEQTRPEWLADRERLEWVAQSRILTLLHLPMGLLGVLGWVYVRTRPALDRVDVIRHGVQVAIYTGLMLAGGGLLVGLTLLMLSFLPGEEVMEDVGIYLGWWVGLAAPFFAHHIWWRNPGALDRVLGTVARIFIPLFLLLEAFFLVLLLSRGWHALAGDRQQLLVFNLLLLAVVGLVGLQGAWEGVRSRATGSLLLGLVALGAVADLVALAAIGSRLAAGGWTPNRLAVLGGNLLLLSTLVGLLVALVQRGDWGPRVRRVLSLSLGAYVIWALGIAFLLPIGAQLRARGVDREEFVESQWLVPASEGPAQPEAEGAPGGQP